MVKRKNYEVSASISVEAFLKGNRKKGKKYKKIAERQWINSPL
jgi:hypothetical protein